MLHKVRSAVAYAWDLEGQKSIGQIRRLYTEDSRFSLTIQNMKQCLGNLFEGTDPHQVLHDAKLETQVAKTS